MPADGVELTPRAHLMTADEVFAIAEQMVSMGVTKIRLTGGEPLVRKDVREIMERLATLPVELTITTNGILVDRFIDTFKAAGIKSVNVSLDTLSPSKFEKITRRSTFNKVWENILLLVEQDFHVKINVVAMRGVNDDEVADFVARTQDLPIHVRFIEFMPFQGNEWNAKKTVGYRELLHDIENHFSKHTIERLTDRKNDTSKNYRIADFKGTFAFITTVTDHFCSSCNRLRLTANGRLKNCLFSQGETDLLSAHRQGEDIHALIQDSIRAKKAIRAGMDSDVTFKDPSSHTSNRSMILIGG